MPNSEQDEAMTKWLEGLSDEEFHKFMSLLQKRPLTEEEMRISGISPNA